jgi:hypothetical protein
MAALALPIAIQLARMAATRIIQRAAIARYGAASRSGAPIPAWARAGFASARASERVSSRSPWGTTGSATGLRQGVRNVFGDPSTAYMQPIRSIAPQLVAKPSVPLGQRVAARPTFLGKTAEVGKAAGRGVLSTADKSLVPGAFGTGEFMLWSAALGQANERNFGQNISSAFQNRPRLPAGAATRAPSEPGLSAADYSARGSAPGPFGPGVPSDWRPSVGMGPTPPPAPPTSASVGSWERNLPFAPTAPSAPATTFDTRPAPTVQGGGLSQDSAFQQARAEYERDMAGLNSGFQNMLNQVKSMYQLSETEEEKQQLRFTLADLEAQFEAGKEAIANLYVDKTQTIQALAASSRVRTGEAAEAASGVYSQAATDLRALQEAANAAQVQANRGLGIGPARETPYAGLLDTMAPIAGQYAQRVGDIGSEGLEYLAGLTESMGAARQGELQSTYAGTRAGSVSDHARRVAERIASERLAKAAAVQSIMGQQLSMQQSMAGRRPQQSEFGAEASAVNNRIEQIASRHFANPQNFANQFASEFGRAPTPEEWNFYDSYADYYRRQDQYERDIQAAELASLRASQQQAVWESLFEQLPDGVPRTVESLRQAKIIP